MINYLNDKLRGTTIHVRGGVKLFFMELRFSHEGHVFAEFFSNGHSEFRRYIIQLPEGRRQFKRTQPVRVISGDRFLIPLRDLV